MTIEMTPERRAELVAFVVDKAERGHILPSQVVSMHQQRPPRPDRYLDFGSVFDTAMEHWLPTHEHCYAVYVGENDLRIPPEILDAAIACVEGGYGPDDENGRIPAHRKASMP